MSMRLSIDALLVLDAIDRKGSFAAAAHAILELAQIFHQQQCGTRLRISAEVFGGCWDALSSGRADLVIGAPGDGPAGGGYTTRSMGNVDWVFAVAPDHPLAAAPEPLHHGDILAHRAVAVADSSRNLPPRTAGLLTGQETLTVHNMAAKLLAQQMGLGVGHLPRVVAERAAAAGTLVIKPTDAGRVNTPLYLAWRGNHKGKALAWWVKQVETKSWLERAMAQFTT